MAPQLRPANARLTVINDACTRAKFAAGRCEDARTGSATARTPG